MTQFVKPGVQPDSEVTRCDDARLCTFMRLGNQDAFREVYDRYHRRLYFFALKYLLSEELTEDAVHDVFVKLWQNRGRLDPEKSLQNYLFTLVRNHVLNMIRNEKNKLLSSFEFNESQFPVPEQTLELIHRKDFYQLLHTVLRSLPDKRRKVFELKMLQGFSNAEVAENLGISVNTVKVHYYYSLKHVKECFDSRRESFGPDSS